MVAPPQSRWEAFDLRFTASPTNVLAAVLHRQREARDVPMMLAPVGQYALYLASLSCLI
jgi:hypothetical protein